jgi:hypothetical protein
VKALKRFLSQEEVDNFADWHLVNELRLIAIDCD